MPDFCDDTSGNCSPSTRCPDVRCPPMPSNCEVSGEDAAAPGMLGWSDDLCVNVPVTMEITAEGNMAPITAKACRWRDRPLAGNNDEICEGLRGHWALNEDLDFVAVFCNQPSYDDTTDHESVAVAGWFIQEGVDPNGVFDPGDWGMTVAIAAPYWTDVFLHGGASYCGGIG
ncbi:MAG: hypothetical protein AABZ47_08530 [Planctomycetota bacterium]